MSKEVIRYLTQNSPYYVASTHSLMISSMKTRTQSGNLQDAMDKMNQHLQSLLSQDIAGETSAEQKSRVKSLIAKDKARTRKAKEKRGSIKKDRGKIAVTF
jgi:peptidyl-tRNA hydrolase ICT1